MSDELQFTGERYMMGKGSLMLGTEHLHRYWVTKDLIKDKVVLDAACGVGYGSRYMSKYAMHVYGMDVDPQTVNHAKNNFSSSNIDFIESSVAQLPLEDNSIDVVISMETIEHVDEEIQVSFLEEIKRVLRKDGTLIMSTPDKYLYSDLPKYKNEFHVKEFYKEEYRDFLQRFFKHVKFYYQEIEVASFLTSSNSEESKLLNTGILPKSGKYIVAQCSNSLIEHSLDSVFVNDSNVYQKFFESYYFKPKVVPPVKTPSVNSGIMASYIRLKWQLIQKSYNKIILFGAGKHTSWLLQNINSINKVSIVAIADDNANNCEICGIEIKHPDQLHMESFDAVVLSTDIHQQIFSDRSRTLWPDTHIIDLYDDLQSTPNFSKN